MLRLGSIAVLLGGVLALDCGGKGAARSDSGTPADSGTPVDSEIPADSGTPADHQGDGIPGVTGLVASNGVPIPDPPSSPTCAALGAVVMSCTRTETCPPLKCDCGGNPLTIDVPMSCEMAGRCLAGVSCPSACSQRDAAVRALMLCAYQGPCESNQDCTDPTFPRCVVLPGQTGGHCDTGQPGGQCFRDADCGTACAVSADGSRSCSDGKSGSACNRNEQCADGNCVLPAGAFSGLCTNGMNGAPCLAAAHCVSGYACAAALKSCSSRGKGAPCAGDGDCDQGFCVQGLAGEPGACDTGEPGAMCKDTSDCRVPICYREKCSAGANGNACQVDADCATKMCASAGANAVPGKCTDGKLGSACWGSSSKQCGAGLHCTSALPGMCIQSGGIGDACQGDADCQNGKCGGAPNAPAGLAVCTEGKLGQRCRDTAQCVAGLHCVSTGFAGVCLAGAVGDPCAGPSDCTSGICSGDGLMPGSTCPAASELMRCGEGGACLAGTCFSSCTE